MRGAVTAFDAEAGLGTITAAEPAAVTYLFHCVDIVDGTRTIDVGAAVRFATMAKLGRLEAVGVERYDGAR